MGVDNSWNFGEFKDNFQIIIKKLDKEVMEFDMIGVDPSIANALRRILIAEVPTIAIEHVFVLNNTSIIQVSYSAFSNPPTIQVSRSLLLSYVAHCLPQKRSRTSYC